MIDNLCAMKFEQTCHLELPNANIFYKFSLRLLYLMQPIRCLLQRSRMNDSFEYVGDLGASACSFTLNNKNVISVGHAALSNHGSVLDLVTHVWPA